MDSLLRVSFLTVRFFMLLSLLSLTEKKIIYTFNLAQARTERTRLWRGDALEAVD
jgi:hypothetical protein